MVCNEQLIKTDNNNSMINNYDNNRTNLETSLEGQLKFTALDDNVGEVEKMHL